MNSHKTAFVLLWLMFLSGCIYYRTAPLQHDYYYLNPNKNLSNIGRVTVVELANNTNHPSISMSISEALFQALQKKQVFGLSIVKQTDADWQRLQLDCDTTYSFKQLLAIRKTLNCDAILLGTVTEYQPYPHMSMGLRLKLIDLNDGQLVWGLEQIWDTSDKTTENRIENYFSKRIRSDLTPLHQELMAVSPIKFVKFVAYEVAETIRERKY